MIGASCRLSSVRRACRRNGIAQYEFMPPEGFTTMGCEFTWHGSHQPLTKKSPSGHSIEGVSSSSQYARISILRQLAGNVVSHICCSAPGPVISASVTVVWGAISIEGETFHPWPRSRAQLAPVPSVAIPPRPFSPVGFSALIERVFARERRARLPRSIPRPLKLYGSVIYATFIYLC